MKKNRKNATRNDCIPFQKHWLVTGGCGFIGSSLIKYLRENSLANYIRILDNLSVGRERDLAEVCDYERIDIQQNSSIPLNLDANETRVELVVGDICDSDLATTACKEIDIIVHLAASTGVALSVNKPKKDMENNVIGIFNMLEAARLNDVKNFIFASSGAPVGESEPPIHEELAPKPVSPYGASKLAGEGYCSAYYRTFGVKTVALRFGNVYGPRSMHKDSVIARFIKRAVSGKSLEIYGDGVQTRDFIYIDDLLTAIMCAVKANIGGEVFQIATHRETSINELADLMKKIIISNNQDYKVTVKHSSERAGDVKRNFSDTSKAKSILGWANEWDLDSGLQNTINWFLNNYKL
jgi:UDP-glucose 4-epimerase